MIRGMTTTETLEMGPDEWRTWRELRLAALAEAPEAFGSALANWTGAGDTEVLWRARLSSVPLNLVLTLNGLPVAMVSATAPAADSAVELISLWVAPEARGRGVADEAVRQVIARSAERFPGSRMVLSVKTANHHATALYERHGFVDSGPSPDDANERLMCH